MANLSLYKVNAKFVGDWNPILVYSENNIVKGSDGTAYVCSKDETTGSAHNPISDAINWAVLIPSVAPPVLTATQVDRVSATTFGIKAGSTSTWRGQEWTLEKSANLVTLVRMKSNCDCNCNCNCSTINCDCASACNCASACDCASDCNCALCSPGWCICDANNQCNCNCPTNCDCAKNCNCAKDCNCASNCDCSSNCNCNCSPV